MREVPSYATHFIVCAVWYNLATCYGYLSSPNPRSEDLDLMRFPVDYRPFRSREISLAHANRLIALGKVDEAEALCSEVLKDWYNHPGCLIVNSQVHLARGDHSRARQSIRDAIDNDPANNSSRILLARLLVQQAAEFYRNGDVESAYEGFRQIVLMDMYESKIPAQLLTEVIMQHSFLCFE